MPPTSWLDDIANGVDRIHGASGEHADCNRRVHVPARHRAVCKREGHDGQAMGKSNRGHTGQADTIADHGRGAGADEHE